MNTITHWIDNRPYASTSSRRGPVYEPASGEQSAQVAFAAAEDVDRAVASAVRAYPGWRETSLSRRQQILFEYRELVNRHKQDMARAVTLEHGKTLPDALGEINRGLEVVEFACNIAHLLKGEYSENVSTGVDTWTVRQPLGVVAGITPFNFPAMVPMWMFPIAIATGNTFLLKPSEKDPSASMLAAEWFAAAGLPDGVFNVVQGDKVAVDRLLEHPDITAISFVGSTPVARYIYETATRAGKRVQALAGAKNHMIVLPDADMDLAADSAVSAGYGSAGERCMAISVVVTVGNAAERLLPKIEKRIARLVIGPGLDAGSELGPLITREHRDRVAGYVDTGVEEGADLIVDGRGLRLKGCENGYFFGPTLFDNVTPDMTIYRDEIFGPVLGVVRTESFEDAIGLINENPWGNGTAVFTNDGGAARKFQHEVLVGMVGINVPIPVPLAFYSFGGWKQSLFGDHSIYGPDGVRFYTRPKVLIGRWPDPIHRGVDLGFPQHD
ncbi:MAG TPA: CoA-acylating methylmalonate-semialdehyde dehydrogenase [Actinobacteria bacterium]|nr:methylmalonate-semialdehyde dehydrogenase [acylating] [bacterium BMS3Bbin01]HDH24650.1 CoA-acylating methylmalonate-semialdehyde dehydrogenase [Actinomycetota bacterium]